MDLQTATIDELRAELVRLGEDQEELRFYQRLAILAGQQEETKLRALLAEEIELLRSVPQTALTKPRDSGRLGT